jgi:hypothetical protein
VRCWTGSMSTSSILPFPAAMRMLCSISAELCASPNDACLAEEAANVGLRSGAMSATVP